MDYLSGLFKMMRAAMTPGTHPQSVRIKTITMEPHPLSMTANGGNMIAKSTRKQPMNNSLFKNTNVRK